ncbi:MAG: phenylalanine--tRNA ligase subunit beta [Omnitrophica bacterium RIFCSPLOWO2_01_FULL_50_24]|nr:MAG: phenylalanine--tRNA ligase subunit beta [Omnitrophica bacterium RIFCSPLOWO2_01_FULL_50_24]
MKISYQWLKDYAAFKGSPAKLAERLTMAGLEVKKIERVGTDHVLETEITTNRPDWLSHVGVAREASAIQGGRLRMPQSHYRAGEDARRTFKVVAPDRKLCPYYSAVLLEDVRSAKTPEFMKARLEACGIRSINLIVDITNYVLLEYGQPLHAFDADQLKGTAISARRAVHGEKMTAIDGVVYELTQDDLVIADEQGAVAIGGVMGGKSSEVSAETRNILLESAFFNPASIRATSRRLALTSESSYRFERRVDPGAVDHARNRAVHLIQNHGSVGRVSRVFKAGVLPIQEPTITLKPSELSQVLGIDIPAAKIKTFLTRLGLKVSGSRASIRVRIPSFRGDLIHSIDLIEEVARLYGYDQIPETLPKMVPQAPRVDPMLSLEDELRHICVGFGLQEVVTFSLVEHAPLEQLGLNDPKWVRLINPQNTALNLMRPTLLPGLAEVIRRNLHVGESDIQLFEVGNRYLANGAGRFRSEERMLGIALAGEGRLGWLDRKRAASFYDLKGMVDEFLGRVGLTDVLMQSFGHPVFETGQALSIMVREEQIGYYGVMSKTARKVYDIKRSVFYAEFNLEKILARRSRSKTVRSISKFPPAPRDLTVLVPEAVKSSSISEEIRKRGKGLVQSVEVFDTFKGEKVPAGKKSLSFRIFYQASDRTLTTEEVNGLHFSIVDALGSAFDARLPEA